MKTIILVIIAAIGLATTTLAQITFQAGTQSSIGVPANRVFDGLIDINNDDFEDFIAYDSNGNFELYIKNKDQSITVVYFDDRTPFDKTAENFLAFWQSAQDKKLGLTVVPTFDYINLRFGNNVFYTTR